jgi:hypothetical protein
LLLCKLLFFDPLCITNALSARRSSSSFCRLMRSGLNEIKGSCLGVAWRAFRVADGGWWVGGGGACQDRRRNNGRSQFDTRLVTASSF